MAGNHEDARTAGGGVFQGFETYYLCALDDLLRPHPEEANRHGRLAREMSVAAARHPPTPSPVPSGERDLQMSIGVDTADPEHDADKPPE
jgi:hypothetical protein